MNDYLKELGQLAEINDKIIIMTPGGNETEVTRKKYQMIGTHTMRRTFITLSLQLGIRPEVLCKITGQNMKTMMKYVKVVDQIEKEEMQKAWG